MTRQQNADSSNQSNGSPWRFSNFARWMATASGKPATFAIALFIVIVWAATGPIFGYSDTWQLVINTGTTIVTFLMVFLIQNTQNRDAKTIHLKLDEIIRSIRRAHNEMIDIEKLSDEELEGLGNYYEMLRKELTERGISLRKSKQEEHGHRS